MRAGSCSGALLTKLGTPPCTSASPEPGLRASATCQPKRSSPSRTSLVFLPERSCGNCPRQNSTASPHSPANPAAGTQDGFLSRLQRDRECALPGAPTKSPRRSPSGGFRFKILAVTYSGMPERHTTIGAERFHFRVRNGIGWFPLAIAARKAVRGSRSRRCRRLRAPPIRCSFLLRHLSRSTSNDESRS